MCAHMGFLCRHAELEVNWFLMQAFLLVSLEAFAYVCVCVCVCIFTLLIAAFTPGSLVLYGKVLNARIKNGTGQVKIAFGRVTVSLIYS